MAIMKRDFLRKTLIALGAAAAIGGATASTSFAGTVTGFEDTDLVGSPASAKNSAVATNPCGPRAVKNPCNPGAAKNPRGAKNPPAKKNPSAEMDYVDS